MNFVFLLLFLLIQVGVNYVLQISLTAMGIDISSGLGLAAMCLLSSLIIAFFGALLSTPRGYKKEFYRQPGFHKTMLTYFVVFSVFDLIFYGYRIFSSL